MKIICGTDFSAQAKVTCELAAKLARRLGDTLVLVHVQEPLPISATPEQPSEVVQLVEGYGRWARAQLTALAGELRRGGASVEEVLTEGFADEVLRTYGDEARLVVVGAHGRRLWELGMGNTTQRLVSTASRPVLVVNDGSAGLGRWLETEGRLRVIVAVDDSPSSDAAIAWARELRSLLPCDVTFVHCCWPPEVYAERVPTPELAPETPGAGDPELAAALRRRVGELPGEGETRWLAYTTWARVGDALANLTQELAAHLLVVGTEQRHGFARLRQPSVSREVLRTTRVPVLCVPGRLAVPVAHRPLPVFRHVLVPTDFSALANRAIPYAYALVRDARGLVELLHVVEGALPEALGSEERRNLEARLLDLVPREAHALGVSTRVHVAVKSRPSDAIARTADVLGVDAICMSTHGRSGLAQIALGSVTHEVTGKARRPVIVVREPQES